MKGVEMELVDGAYPLLASVWSGSDADAAFTDCDVVVLVGGFPRKQGMLRKDLIGKNTGIFSAQGKALQRSGKADVKVLVVANPANTNCAVLMRNAPKIPRANFSAMTRLDHNRAASQIAARAGVLPGAVRDVVIWGNHSATQVPDAAHATVQRGGGGGGGGGAMQTQTVAEAVGADNAGWLGDEFIGTVQQRGAAVIKARGASSAMSAANGAADHLRDWLGGSGPSELVSMAVCSDGNPYGALVPDDLIFSFPVVCDGRGGYEIRSGLALSDATQNLIRKTVQELQEEGVAAAEAVAQQSKL